MGHPRMLSDEGYTYHAHSIHPDGAADYAYLTGQGETPLRWGGTGAPALGLQGRVTEEDYRRVFAPGAGLGVRTERRGLEIVFGTRKSVSVLGLVLDGHEDDAMAIMDAELAANLAYLEGVVRTVGGRRGRLQQRVATGGLVYASTRHLYSRALDPDIHQHVLLANVVEMADGVGGWKALDSSLIHKHVQAADMAGRVAGAWEATRRGYAIERVWDRRQLLRPEAERGEKTNWRITGIPMEVEEKFSKRSQEIDDGGKARGWDDSDHVRNALARSTRAEKRYAELGDLKPRWDAELLEVGVDRLVCESSLVGEAMRYRTPELDAREVRAAALLAEDGKLTDRKVWCRRDVVVAAGPALFGVAPAELDRTVAAVLADSEAVPLLPRPGASERGWSTATTLAVEGAVAKATERAMTELASPGPAHRVAEVTLPWYTDGQKAVIAEVLAGEHRMDLVCGVAGAGKTTVLAAVREAYEADGWQVVGTATSGQAARNLGDETGMPASTIRSLLWKVDNGRLTFDDRTLLVLDEAGMVDDRDWLRLLRVAEQQSSRIVAVGDHRQLGAVGPGGSFEALQARHPEGVHDLSENVRQQDPAERVALEHLRSGRVIEAVEWYATESRVRVAPTGAEAMALAVAAWWVDIQAGKDAGLLAYTRRNVAQLNQLARAQMVDAGLVDVDREMAGFAPGDRIVILAGTPGTVETKVVTSERGWVVDCYSVTDPGNVSYAVLVELDSGVRHVYAGDDLEQLSLGYAMTTHRFQGATVDVCHRIEDGGGRELAYVAMSRGREANFTYCVADTPEQAVEDLCGAWKHEQRDIWVHDTDRQLYGEEQIGEARLFEWPRPPEIVELELGDDLEMELG